MHENLPQIVTGIDPKNSDLGGRVTLKKCQDNEKFDCSQGHDFLRRQIWAQPLMHDPFYLLAWPVLSIEPKISDLKRDYLRKWKKKLKTWVKYSPIDFFEGCRQ